ncbi:ankyrin repeat-containing protein ITN1-like [Momordica charantia]|uniref:Ankyrin repeat-containing protein ITN1-like n=1 Tax=Momordica charantia TaxID=3673 RepID=A0A6J1DYG6_MOMCH|nr:ankyrin repeat-containing protein ITN1-like [Momordica charantia]
MVELMWEVVVDKVKKENVVDFIKHPSSMLHDAARVGNVDFLRVLLRLFPDLAWNIDDKGKNIFHVAVENRRESVFCLIYEMGDFLDFLDCLPYYFDEENVSLLQLAAKKPAKSDLNRISGAAFQMHNELLWFKGVEKIVGLTLSRNIGKQTAREVFTQEHEELVKEGEKWIKERARSCMVVATLIATVVFAAAFTVPGSVNNNTGFPMFLHDKWFTAFVLSDAIAMIASSTSILMFLSILPSCCAEDDFFFWLPYLLDIGHATLFVSVVTMLLAFGAAFFLYYGTDTAPVPLAIACAMALNQLHASIIQLNLWADAFPKLRTYWFFLVKNRTSDLIRLLSST